MKTIFLTFCLIATAQSAFAALCSVAPAGQPCAPDPGEETKDAKQEILDLIDLAKTADPTVKLLEGEYRKFRNDKNASTEEKLAACEAYRTKKMAQDQLYKEAMDKTAALYHVQPDETGPITIGKPSDPAVGYMSGLTAVWNPQVTDSGPGVMLAIKVNGSDGQPHYSGAVHMDPTKPDEFQGLTLEDGRVMVLKGVFDIARRNKNPGILASVLYHESRHFNHLSRESSDGSGTRRSWDSPEEEEWDAYVANVATVKAFGLSKKDIDGLKARRDTYGQAMSSRQLTSRGIDPHQEKIWKAFYENGQINLEAEYAALTKIANDKRDRQLEIQKRDQEERERGEENARRFERQMELYNRRLMENEAARCGYKFSTVSASDDRIILFRGGNSLHIYSPGENPDLQSVKIMMLITRACDNVQDVQAGVAHDLVKACNDAAPALQNQMRYDLRQQIEKANDGWNAECAENILANASRITDSKSFDKVVADYQKAAKKKRAEEERDRRRADPEENNNPGGGRSRPPDGDDNNRIWDPGCGCWTRRY